MATLTALNFDYDDDPDLNRGGSTGIAGGQPVSIIDDRLRLLMGNTAAALSTTDANIRSVNTQVEQLAGPDSVNNTMIVNGAVTGAKVAQRTITGGTDSGNIARDTIHEWNMAPDSISRRELQGDCVLNANIVNHQVTGGEFGKIANATITIWNMADNSVGTDQLVDGAVTPDKLSTGAIARLKLGPDAILRQTVRYYYGSHGSFEVRLPPGIVSLEIEMVGGYRMHFMESPGAGTWGQCEVLNIPEDHFNLRPPNGVLRVRGGGPDPDTTFTMPNVRHQNGTDRFTDRISVFDRGGIQPPNLINPDYFTLDGPSTNIHRKTISIFRYQRAGDRLFYTTHAVEPRGTTEMIDLSINVIQSNITAPEGVTVTRNLPPHGYIRVSYWS